MPLSVFSGSPNSVLSESVYGCLFCLTGKEERVAELVEANNASIRAIPVRQQKRKTVCGRTEVIDQICFPGYVFLEVKEGAQLSLPVNRCGLISLLSSRDGDWKLHGDDDLFARWVFARNGYISFSCAYSEGDRIHIVSGPLKDLEGSIVRIDKRNRNAQIALKLQSRIVKAWLGFELLEKEAVAETGRFSKETKGK